MQHNASISRCCQETP